jgi:hypothetical protein
MAANGTVYMFDGKRRHHLKWANPPCVDMPAIEILLTLPRFDFLDSTS